MADNPSQMTEFATNLATEKVKLEQLLETYSYMNTYGVTLEQAIERETDRLLTMKKLSAVNAAIDTWMRTPGETHVEA